MDTLKKRVKGEVFVSIFIINQVLQQAGVLRKGYIIGDYFRTHLFTKTILFTLNARFQIEAKPRHYG